MNKIIYVVSCHIQHDLIEFKTFFKHYIHKCYLNSILLKNGIELRFISNENMAGIRKNRLYSDLFQDFLKYSYNDLQDELEIKNEIIDIVKQKCNQEITAATIQYERHKRNNTWLYIVAHKRILEILEKGDNVMSVKDIKNDIELKESK